jgi:hypothetical protein
VALVVVALVVVALVVVVVALVVVVVVLVGLDYHSLVVILATILFLKMKYRKVSIVWTEESPAEVYGDSWQLVHKF